MSLRVVGYQDGKPLYRDDGPAYARRQGYGGTALGHFTGTVLRVGLSPAVRTAAAQRGLERKRLQRERARNA